MLPPVSNERLRLIISNAEAIGATTEPATMLVAMARELLRRRPSGREAMNELSDKRLREIAARNSDASIGEGADMAAELLSRRPTLAEVEEAIVNYADACMEYEHARENCTVLEMESANDKCEATLAALRSAIRSAIRSGPS